MWGRKGVREANVYFVPSNAALFFERFIRVAKKLPQLDRNLHSRRST